MKRRWIECFIFLVFLGILVPFCVRIPPKPAFISEHFQPAIPWNHSYHSTKSPQSPDGKLSEHIVIGIVTCAGGFQSTGRGKKEQNKMMETLSETTTLIKSLLISAKLGKAKHISFHIFTDSRLLNEAMQNKIDQYRTIMMDHLQLSATFYNVFRSVPPGYERDFVDNTRLCGYVRVMFPWSLPVGIDEILYLDTDVIITGNIVEIWKTFKEKVGNSTGLAKLAAMVPNYEIANDQNFRGIYNMNFKGIPHVPPRGVNSGVMYMKLDAMRKCNWTEDVMQIYLKYRDTLFGDQQLINIFFSANLDKLVQFPCQYNFQHLHCEQGLTCESVTKDPAGIHIMHGAGQMFVAGRSHAELYKRFKSFSLSNIENVETLLFLPLRKYYSNTSGGRATCDGVLGKFLFKDYFIK